MERELRQDWRSWATCFCTILVLCILAEQVEAATDAMVIEKISREHQDAADIRQSGIEACQALEKPMNYVWELFKGIQGKHNPIKDNCPIDNGSGQNKGEAEFINEIHQLMSENGMYFQ
jgi:hypothetical protein